MQSDEVSSEGDRAGNETPRPPRRVRYRGTHPRQFEDKYKELAPDRHAELVEHVRARGMTPAGQHVPIMVAEVVQALAPRPGERGVDVTLGYGGHTRALLAALAPKGQLLALDADPIELERTRVRLRAEGFDESQLLIARTNFAGLDVALSQVGWETGVDFVFADLGVSSMQFDSPARGFTFKADGPLDMRMNPAREPSAATWLERVSEDQLAAALAENADEPFAARLARALTRVPRGGLATTLQLAEAVRRALPSRVTPDEAEASVRRVFQAVRIAVNDEFGALDALLRMLPNALRSGGRAAILTFHSGEDRRVKKAFERGLSSGEWSAIAADVQRATPEERRSNPRSSSAKLRWARRM